MDALANNREMLLLARAKELQHEYEHLVRSLEAAYENVRQLNAAMTENRAETKRVFQERLEVLALRRNSSKRDGDAAVVACNVLSVTEKSSSVIKRSVGGDAVTKKPRILAASGRSASDTRRYFITYTKTKKGVTGTKNDLLAIRSNSSDAIAPSTSTKPSPQKRAVIKGYVGDEHSYAGTNVKTATLGQSVTQGKENSEKSDGTEADVDLSIVKSELNDESNNREMTKDSVADEPTATKEQNPSDGAKTSSAVTLATTPTLKLVQREPYEHRIQDRPKITPKILPKIKPVPSVKPIDEETLKRKRVMTRNRMRRWREKKRLEEMTSKIGNLCSKDKYSTMYTKVYY